MAMRYLFNRNTRLLPSDLPIIHSRADNTDLPAPETKPFADQYRGAHEMPVPRPGERLIKTKLCCVIPDHAHFNVRSSGKIVWIVQLSVKTRSGEGGWVQLIKY